MQNTQIQKIKAKLIKLMKKEESSRELGNLQEAEAFSAKIQQLMIDYELEIQDIIDADKAESMQVDGELIDLNELTNRHESSWIVYLYNGVAIGNFCKVIIRDKISSLYINLIGSDMNREFTHFMANQLIPKLRTLARKSFKEYDGPDKRNTYIRSFLRGAADGIAIRLKDELKKQENSEKMDALVIQKDALVNEYIANKFGRLKDSRSRKSSSSAGYQSGYQSAKNVSINKGVKSGASVKSQALLG